MPSLSPRDIPVIIGVSPFQVVEAVDYDPVAVDLGLRCLLQ